MRYFLLFLGEEEDEEDEGLYIQGDVAGGEVSSLVWMRTIINLRLVYVGPPWLWDARERTTVECRATQRRPGPHREMHKYHCL